MLDRRRKRRRIDATRGKRDGAFVKVFENVTRHGLLIRDARQGYREEEEEQFASANEFLCLL